MEIAFSSKYIVILSFFWKNYRFSGYAFHFLLVTTAVSFLKAYWLCFQNLREWSEFLKHLFVISKELWYPDKKSIGVDNKMGGGGQAGMTQC